MAQGKKLFLRHLYLLPEGMSLNRCCPGCEGSPVIALALLRYYLLAMSSSESRGLPVMCCAVLMTLCRFFLSATEQWAYQAVMQYIRMLSMVLRWMATYRFSSKWFPLSILRKCSRSWAFFTMFAVQERSLVICVHRNLKEDTRWTQSLLMYSGAGSPLCFLKSITISFVLLVLSSRLCWEHHPASLLTSSLYAVSSPPLMRTMALSANLMMVLEGWVGVQSSVRMEYRRRLSTQPWGDPVLSVRNNAGGAYLNWFWVVSQEVLDPGTGVGGAMSVSLSTRMSAMMVLNAKL